MAKRSMNEVEFQKYLSNLSKEMEDECKKTIKWYASKMVAMSKSLAPVDTGYLMGSIEMQTEKDGMEAYVFVGAEYGCYVEFGTFTHYAQPFFYPAFEQLAPQFIKKMEQKLQVHLEG